MCIYLIEIRSRLAAERAEPFYLFILFAFSNECIRIMLLYMFYFIEFM